MDPLRYWQLKVFQLLHDPPNKPFHLAARGKGSKRLWVRHQDLARRLFETFADEKLRCWARADRAATGADRPVLGQRPVLPFNVEGSSLCVHPLATNSWIPLQHADDTTPVRPDQIALDDAAQVDVAEVLAAIADPDWKDVASVRAAAMLIWRRMREELTAFSVEQSGLAAAEQSYRFGDPLWERMPADTRIPDHSIWDHTRMTAALSFLDAPLGTKSPPSDEAEPWLLQVSLWPIGEFIGQSRKAQDLWVSSFLLADLAWHAMEPIVVHYGPENIVYPDLRGNPRADHWLYHTNREYMPSFLQGKAPSSFAALLPNAFTAIVPRGGDAGHLIPLQEMAQRCREGMRRRWQELSGLVRDWFVERARTENRLSDSQVENLVRVWDDQHQGVVQLRWSAVPWLAADAAAGPRDARLQPWMGKDVWNRYEHARTVFAHLDDSLPVGRRGVDFLESERGFDYALTHHQLRVRHGMRKQTATATAVVEQPGEKCTLCGQRTALGDFAHTGADRRAAIDSRRQAVRQFWSKKWLDPEEEGAERLCAVCAFKRFLVEADGASPEPRIDLTWAGSKEDLRSMREKEGDKVRVPFPSTSAIAAQRFLAAIANRPELQPQIEELCRAHSDAIGDETLFPRGLPALAAAYESAREAHRKSAQKLLRLEPQETLFPRTLDVLLRRKPEKAAAVRALQTAVSNLLLAARKIPSLDASEPGSRIAVLRLDGDAMGMLLLGDADHIETRWRDVLHPAHVKSLEGSAEMQRAGWSAGSGQAGLLDSKRLMGPSLHAFISRALADFTHRIVPWVVEREHHGRLVYAGGDDVLALAPAGEAVRIAARLQELFSAAWLIDRQYDADTWEWRRPGAKFEHDPGKARDRFVILGRVPSPEGEGGETPAGPLIAMLGPGASLSAGIALGHFKTPLRGMLQQSHHLLDEVAKERTKKAAVALSYYTRSGAKYQFAMKWKGRSDLGEDRMPVEEALDAVSTAFRDDRLPARLPYKLREAADSIHGALDFGRTNAKDPNDPRSVVAAELEVEKRLLPGLLHRELDGKSLEPNLERAVMALWRTGLAESRWRPDPEATEADATATKNQRPAEAEDERSRKPEPERMVDGLLLARALAKGEPEDDE